MIGKILNSRYELLEKIDAGGMAIVYLGKDNLLDRKVAVKVLQPQFAHNKEAVKRFHQEAKAVASLSHVNIVNIFDIGEEGDLHYIVMEYIKGKDLKKKLQEVGRLEPKRAVEIIKGVCRALIKAHRSNIVHCDIKPHNIMLTEDGTVKVTDFGIARAVTGATMTKTDSIRGSAHYLSPEQAEGDRVSTKSDIYSLGIVLYELMTGRLPFSGDSSVSIALKHINETPPKPTEVNPDLPKKVEDIILRAIAKESEERYNSVAELLRDLKEVEEELPDKEVSNQATMVISRDELEELEDKTKEENKEDEKKIDQEIGKEEFNISSKPNKSKKSKKKLFFTLGIISLVMFLILGAGYYLLMNYLTVETVETPDVINKKFEVAKEKMTEVGLGIEVYYRSHNNEVPKDHVISQSPKPGEVVKKNRVVEVVLSEGSELTEVPDLSNRTLREARVAVDKSNLTLGEVKEEYNKEVTKGNIISQEPDPESEVESGTPIKLVVSKGPRPQNVIVPDLIGLRREEAIEKLREQSLIVGQELKKKSLNYREGHIIAQDPVSGTEVVEGSTIQLIVSSGIRNPYNSSIKERTISINVPSGQKRNVRIVVEDDNGRRIVYEQEHLPGEKIEKEVITVGATIIQVYLDGQLYNEQRLKGE